MSSSEEENVLIGRRESSTISDPGIPDRDLAGYFL
jgi:hypothetical protein